MDKGGAGVGAMTAGGGGAASVHTIGTSRASPSATLIAAFHGARSRAIASTTCSPGSTVMAVPHADSGTFAPSRRTSMPAGTSVIFSVNRGRRGPSDATRSGWT